MDRCFNSKRRRVAGLANRSHLPEPVDGVPEASADHFPVRWSQRAQRLHHFLLEAYQWAPYKSKRASQASINTDNGNPDPLPTWAVAMTMQPAEGTLATQATLQMIHTVKRSNLAILVLSINSSGEDPEVEL